MLGLTIRSTKEKPNGLSKTTKYIYMHEEKNNFIDEYSCIDIV